MNRLNLIKYHSNINKDFNGELMVIGDNIIQAIRYARDYLESTYRSEFNGDLAISLYFQQAPINVRPIRTDYPIMFDSRLDKPIRSKLPKTIPNNVYILD